ncbi:polysaccharide biosynthesis/export family protein [Alicycliphilus denitrificans]|uniref:polysaccharide biosynthesis/export family protein n=1 Tax=Alicycliphilus denitrificans TaxID=179636 RepID=UPI00385144EF
MLSLWNQSSAAPVAPAAQAGSAASTDGAAGDGSVVPEVQRIAITAELIQRQKSVHAPRSKAMVQHLFDAPRPYTIGPGDVLNIVVWDHPEFNLVPAGSAGTTMSPDLVSQVGNGYNVNNQGSIQFPYVGTIALNGLTEDQARELLTRKLARYLKNPQLTVRVQAYRSGRIYLDGQVRAPGLQTLNDVPLTLPESLARAGGLLPTADRSNIILTRGERTTVINLNQLVADGVNPNQIMLAPGDMVRVGSLEDAKVYVMGEVLRPSALQLRDGKLNLNQALGESGGINPVSGNPQQVYVIRSQSGAQPQVFHLNASNGVAYALAEGFELKARDVVFVDPTALVRWNRVISLLLPSAQAVNVSRDAVNR